MKPMIFDSHAHYDSHQFDEDREELLRVMAEKNIGTIVNSAADWDSLTEVVELAEKYPFAGTGRSHSTQPGADGADL